MPPRIPSWSDAVRRARAAADPSWERILAQAMADDPSGRAHLARLRFALEDHDLQAAQRLIEHPPPTPPPGWKRSVAHWQERMGREVESLQTIAAHADRQELARRAARLGDVWYAAELADPALPESYEWYWAAGTLAEHRQHLQELEPVDAGPVWKATQQLRLGDFDRARQLLASESSPEAALLVARMQVWARQDPTHALAEAKRLGADLQVRSTLAAAHLANTGDWAGCLRTLEPGIAASTDPVRLAWCVEALLRLDRAEEARKLGGRMRSLKQHASVPVTVLQHWTHLPKRHRPTRPDHLALLTRIWAPERVPRRHAFARTMDLFGGHRGPGLVVLRNGRLSRREMPKSGFVIGPLLQAIIRTRGYRAAKRLFREHRGVPPMPDALIFEGELDLWFGEYDVAQRTFERAISIAKDTKWAWIGLGATWLLRGQPARAIQVWSRRFVDCPTLPWRPRLFNRQWPGPTLWIYLAEAQFRLGQRTRAMATAGKCLRDKPRRISAVLLIARLAADNGDSDLLRSVLDDLAERLPGLAAVARLHEGTPEAAHDRLLLAWRGNRSSNRITWRRGDALDTAAWSHPRSEHIRRAMALSDAAWSRYEWRS